MVYSPKQWNVIDRVVVERMVLAPPFQPDFVTATEPRFVHVHSGSFSLGQVKADRLDSLLIHGASTNWQLQPHTQPVEVLVVNFDAELLRYAFRNGAPQIDWSGATPPENPIAVVAHDAVLANYLTSIDYYFEHPEQCNEELVLLKMKEALCLLLHGGYEQTVKSIFAHAFAGAASGSPS